MVSDLEGLIAGLLVHISCAGEQGCNVRDVVDAIHSPLRSDTESPSQIREGDPSVQHKTASTIWSWLLMRRDISFGPNRKYNHLSLDESLALAPPPNVNGQEREATELTSETQPTPHDVRVYASEEAMWQALTGRCRDYKHVPKSEWMLLLGIASTRTKGILQGDLGRLVDQDKRSVPKRTDALLKKGYIVKRTTLVRGTKTSKMWLKLFAPPLPKDSEGADETRPDMTFTRAVLADNLDPVPWHTRWTGESIDYTALATTIMAIVKEWGVLRITDLKQKLGLLGMPWQMRTLAKVCRFLNARGVIQYVAAKLDNKVFKDCIKYIRDLTSEDMGALLATGRRHSKQPPRNPDLDGLDGSKQLLDQTSNASEVSIAAPWSLDKPVPIIIAEMAQRTGDTGLTNPDVYALTLGPSFSRHLSSMTTALSVPNLQPSHLSHFQLRSEHTRAGKVASYRYFAQHDPILVPQPTGDGGQPENMAAGQTLSCTDPYGFCPIPTTGISSEPSATLAELCKQGLPHRKPNGRPRKNKVQKQKPVPAPKPRGRPKQQRGERSPVRQTSVTQETETVQEEGIRPNGAATQEPNVRPEVDEHRQETAQQEVETSRPSRASSEKQDTGNLLVTLKVPPGKIQPATSTPVRVTRTRSARSSAKKAELEIASTATNTEEIEAENEVEKDNETETPSKTPSSKKRGRPKKREPKKKGSGAQAADADFGSRPFVCDKCGGRWKNDIGLKYHLEKSRTSCNPSFDESTAAPVRRGKKRAASEMEDPDTSTPAVELSPRVATTPDEPDAEKESKDQDQDQDQDQNQDEPEPEHQSFSTPAKRISKLRGPVASRPTWASRPTVSFKSNSFQVNPEWRRPPVTSFDTPKTASLSNETNGALVQIENGQPRPLLASLDRLSLFASSPKTPRLKTRGKDSQPAVETPRQEQLPNGQDTGVKTKTPAPVNSLSKLALNSRIYQIVQSILAEQSGVFPGGKPLWQAITIRWTTLFPNEAFPQVRAYQAAFRDMLKNKTVAEHWHTFRSAKGVTEKCNVILQAGIDPFSPAATKTVEEIKSAHPEIYLPPPFDAVAGTELLKRGRRDLPEEIESLDAPVYVARAAQKRALEELDDEGDEVLPPPKRGRRRKRVAREASPSILTKPEEYTWMPVGQEDETGERMWYEHFDSFMAERAPESIHFLEPNTGLFDGTDVYEEGGWGCLSGNIVFDKAILVSGDNGAWPYLSTQDLELQDGSYNLRGWFPDSAWYAWSSIVDVIDQRALALRRLRRQHRTDLGRYQRFVERLHCCIDTERAWTESFIHAPPRAAGPYNIFISFFSGADMKWTDISTISWPSEWQLTPKSFPASVPDRSLLVDSQSDDDEDNSFEWPSLPVPGAGLSNGQQERPAAYRQQQQPPQAKVKRVRLTTRTLTSIPVEGGQSESQNDQSTTKDSTEEADRLLAAIIAVRVLLGGADKAVDWGLLLKLHPTIALRDLRRFWITARREQGAYIKKLTKDFQDKFLIAYQRDELPEFDFDDPLDYDWHGLIDWTLQLPRRKGVELPSTRDLLEDNFTIHKAPHVDEDWREKFYHPQSSVFSRFEATTSGPAVVTVDKMLSGLGEHVELGDNVIARSWVRSLCCTDDSRYSVDQIRQKFSSLAKGDQDRNSQLLKQAIEDLTQQRIICRSKRPPLGGRPYRLNEWYYHMLGKLAHRAKYQEAADFKTKLDTVFRRGDSFKVPFNLDDGAVMALTNLNASERIKLVAVDVPHIPLGFEAHKYESRRLDKSCYHFGIVATPTETYKYDEDIDVLRKTIHEGPPTGRNVLPQWVDFFGRRDAQRFMDILGAFCFVFATRGCLTIEGVCSALKPILEEFEAQMIMSWGKKTGVFKESEDGLGLMVGEWWWLAVPWQWGRQLKRRGHQDDD
ncbi:hypothetical protein FALBO_3195 [Fusarium albosuccineum]|uniref:Uncharacterized protein n=1 Tax=Fusarium albosuccineum TaxID=1237068 RepID=A0A8H4LL84_9HYPO|nr:hypothetical protein FALBO_3195 [Fusarium albosuccineum]